MPLVVIFLHYKPKKKSGTKVENKALKPKMPYKPKNCFQRQVFSAQT